MPPQLTPPTQPMQVAMTLPVAEDGGPPIVRVVMGGPVPINVGALAMIVAGNLPTFYVDQGDGSREANHEERMNEAMKYGEYLAYLEASGRINQVYQRGLMRAKAEHDEIQVALADADKHEAEKRKAARAAREQAGPAQASADATLPTPEE